MNAIGLEWLAVFLFLLLVISSAVSEAMWLVRRGWASVGRAAAFVIITDLAAMSLSAFVMFASMGAIFVMVMGPAGTGSDTPQWAYVLVMLIAALAPIVLLFLIKLAFLYLLKLRSGKPAVIYAAVLSILIPLMVLVPPTVFVFLLTRG